MLLPERLPARLQEITEGRGQLAGRGVSGRWVLRHRLEADRLELGGDRAVDPARRRGASRGNRNHESLGSSILAEGKPAGQHLVQDHAEGVNVAPRVAETRVESEPFRRCVTRDPAKERSYRFRGLMPADRDALKSRTI